MDLDSLRFPVGRLQVDPAPGDDLLKACVRAVADLPDALDRAVHGLDDAAIDTAYRPDGWTLRQVVHHLADSHANALTRFKLALTEDEPTIKAYDEKAWAGLPDSAGDIGSSLAIVRGLHERWEILLAGAPPDWPARVLIHPDRGRLTLGFMIQLYAWHGRHHVAHITTTRERLGL